MRSDHATTTDLMITKAIGDIFPFIDPNFAETSYFDLIYLTNPKVKNNLSFEFELVGLTNILTPIDNIINDGLFN